LGPDCLNGSYHISNSNQRYFGRSKFNITIRSYDVESNYLSRPELSIKFEQCHEINNRLRFKFRIEIVSQLSNRVPQASVSRFMKNSLWSEHELSPDLKHVSWQLMRKIITNTKINLAFIIFLNVKILHAIQTPPCFSFRIFNFAM